MALMGFSYACQVTEEPATTRRRGKKMSSPERWEVTQLIKSGVLDVTEYPDFDDETGQVGPFIIVLGSFVVILHSPGHTPAPIQILNHLLCSC